MTNLPRHLRMPWGSSSSPTPNPAPSPQTTDDDFSAFELRTVIKDFKLSAELFASIGDIVLMCGRSTTDKGHNLLLSYDIPSQRTGVPAPIRLIKVNRLTKNNVTQLETAPVFRLALLLADGIVSLHDIHSLAEIATVSTVSTIMFTYW